LFDFQSYEANLLQHLQMYNIFRTQGIQLENQKISQRSDRNYQYRESGMTGRSWKQPSNGRLQPSRRSPRTARLLQQTLQYAFKILG